MGRVSDGSHNSSVSWDGWLSEGNLLSGCTKEELHIHKHFDLLTNCMPKESGRGTRERIHCFYLHGDNLFIIKRRNFKRRKKGCFVVFRKSD